MSKASKATKLATRTAADEERAAQTMAVVREPAHDGWRPAGEHAALGKAARKAAPLSAHAGWTPAPTGPTLSLCCAARTVRAACSSCRSAGVACPSRRSRSTAAPP